MIVINIILFGTVKCDNPHALHLNCFQVPLESPAGGINGDWQTLLLGSADRLPPGCLGADDGAAGDQPYGRAQ